MLTPSLIKKAHEWRAKHECTGGVIVIHKRKVQGWVNELRNPESWMPGCIALDCNGNQFLATGGNDYDGATQWAPIPTSKSKPHQKN